MILDDIKAQIAKAWERNRRRNIPADYVLVLPYARDAEFHIALGALAEMGNYNPERRTYMNCRIAYTEDGGIAVYSKDA